MRDTFNKLIGKLDTLIYLIVGPFGVLYVFHGSSCSSSSKWASSCRAWRC